MNLETLKIVITAQANNVQTEVAKAQRAISTLKDKKVLLNTRADTNGLVSSLKTSLMGGSFAAAGEGVGDDIVGGIAQGFTAQNAQAITKGFYEAIATRMRLLTGVFATNMMAIKGEITGFRQYAAGIAEGIKGPFMLLNKGMLSSMAAFKGTLMMQMANIKAAGGMSKMMIADNKAAFLGLGKSIAAMAGVGVSAIKLVGIALVAVTALLIVLIPLFAIGLGSALNNGSQQAVQFDSSVKNLNFTLGESTGLMQDWIDKGASGLNMSKLTAQTYASKLSLASRDFTNTSKDNAVAAATLLKTAAIVSSKTGETIEQTLGRITSGLRGETESIEDIGIYVTESQIVASAAYKKLAQDTGTTYANMTEQQKKYLRYLAIVDQSAVNYGNQMQTGAAATSAAWTASLENLKLAFSQALLPLAGQILPILTTIVNWVSAVIRVITFLYTAWVTTVRAMFGLFDKEIVKTNTSTKKLSLGTGGVASNLGSAANSAKEIRKSLAGFDEINNLGAEPKAAASGGGGSAGGGGGGGSFGDLGEMPDVSSLTNGADTLYNKFKKWYDGLVNWVADIIFWFTYTMPKAVSEFGDKVKVKLEEIKLWAKTKLEEIRTNVILWVAGVMVKWNEFKEKVKGVFTGIRDWIKSKFNEALATIVLWIAGILVKWNDFKEKTKTKFREIGAAIGDAIGSAFKSTMNTVFKFVEDKVNGMIRAINKALTFINKIPGVAIPAISTISIPRLARGGVVDSGQIYQAGERGKEAIVPLENNTQWINKVAASMVGMMGATSSGQPAQINLLLDGKLLARTTINNINSIIKQEGSIPLNI